MNHAHFQNNQSTFQTFLAHPLANWSLYQVRLTGLSGQEPPLVPFDLYCTCAYHPFLSTTILYQKAGSSLGDISCLFQLFQVRGVLSEVWSLLIGKHQGRGSLVTVVGPDISCLVLLLFQAWSWNVTEALMLSLGRKGQGRVWTAWPVIWKVRRCLTARPVACQGGKGHPGGEVLCLFAHC